MINSIQIYRFAGLLYIFMMFSNVCLFAQSNQTSNNDEQNIIKKNVRISGNIGTYGELYGISGREGRRPNSTGRLFFTPTITFLNELSLNFNVLLSTEGVSARQNISQIGLDPSWKWGSAHVGDFSETFSKYTLSGITIRGGGLNLKPADGAVRLSVVGGRSQRAVDGGANNKSFERSVWGGMLGVGKPSGSFLDVMVVKIEDDIGSLQPDSLLSSPDSLLADTAMIGTGPPVNPFAVTPQENLVGGVKWRLNVIPRTLSWESEVSGSVFTRDLRSEKVDIEEVGAPSFADNLFTPRFSSSVDFIVDTKLNLNLSNFNLSSAYKWIGPGYTSLGTSYLINDQQEFSSNASFRISQTSFSLNVARINDNLLDQKRFTSVQNRFGGTVSTRFSRNWNSSYTANIITRGNDSNSDTTRADFSNLLLSTNQNFVISNETGFQSFSINYSFQTANTESGVQFENRAKTHTINSQTQYKFMENLNSTVSFGLVNSQPNDSVSITTQTYSFGTRHQVFENKLSNNLSVSTSFREDVVSIRTRLTSSFRLTGKDQMSLSLSFRNFFDQNDSANDFNEFVGSIRVTHRF